MGIITGKVFIYFINLITITQEDCLFCIVLEQLNAIISVILTQDTVHFYFTLSFHYFCEIQSHLKSPLFTVLKYLG